MNAFSNINARTRLYRKIHIWISIPFILFFIIICISGMLLGVKKQTNLLPPVQTGGSSKSEDWISLDSLNKIAENYLFENKLSNSKIKRIDIRPKYGVAKILFTLDYKEIQIDCSSGKILSESVRKSDFIEQIHDGSILNRIFNTNGESIKTIYTLTISTILVLLSISGFWIWLNPKRIKLRRKS